MLSRVSFALAFASSAFFGLAGPAFAASERTEVGVGTAIVVLCVVAFAGLIYAIKWWLGAAEPPALPPEGLPYHSLPAGGSAHGDDDIGHGAQH